MEKQNYIIIDQLNDIYEEVTNGIKLRSRSNWYELGEKSNKCFLNLGKIESVKIFCVTFAPRLKK